MPVAISHAMMPGGGWVSTFEDVTERKRADQDSLTGSRQQTCVPRTPRRDRGFASPGSFGRDAARSRRLQIRQRHLWACGRRCRAQARRRHHALLSPQRRSRSRLGGDEFAVFLGEISEAEAVALAERLIAEIRMPHTIVVDVVAHVGVSIGVALTSSGFATDEVLMKADVALYDAKESGKSAVRVYSTEMSAKVKARRELEADFRETVATGRGFALFYQPIMNTETRLVTAREALLRWQHPGKVRCPRRSSCPWRRDGPHGAARVLGSGPGLPRCLPLGRRARVTINVAPLELGPVTAKLCKMAIWFRVSGDPD